MLFPLLLLQRCPLSPPRLFAQETRELLERLHAFGRQFGQDSSKIRMDTSSLFHGAQPLSPPALREAGWFHQMYNRIYCCGMLAL